MILVEHEPVSGVDGATVARVTISRPEKRNALTAEMMVNLREAVERVSGDASVRALLLRGEGPVFCAGFDLDACKHDPLAMRALLTGLSATIGALRRCPCPVVVAAQGAAIAGGCALLGGADFVVTDSQARFGYPVTLLGISPAVSSPFMRQMLGEGRARQRLLDPTLIDGREAARVGLAHECLDRAEDVPARAEEVALMFARKPPGALRETKRWLNELDGSNDAAAVEGALHASLGLTGGEEEREMLATFWEKKR